VGVVSMGEVVWVAEQRMEVETVEERVATARA